MLSQKYPTEFQLNKANTFDIEVQILDLSIMIDINSSKIHDKGDDFNFEIV